VQNRLRTTDQAWCDDLILALRVRDVPGARIGEVLAEVQSHLAETGEDPRQAFGTPREYAGEVAEALGLTPVGLRQRLRRAGWGDLAVALLLGVAGFLLADALWSQGAGESAALGLPAWVVVVLAVALLCAGIGRLVTRVRHEPGDRVVDPRTGTDMVAFGPWRTALLVAVPVVGLAAMLVGGFLSR
jgi:hypothetical protein